MYTTTNIILWKILETLYPFNMQLHKLVHNRRSWFFLFSINLEKHWHISSYLCQLLSITATTNESYYIVLLHMVTVKQKKSAKSPENFNIVMTRSFTSIRSSNIILHKWNVNMTYAEHRGTAPQKLYLGVEKKKL